ncbi:MAG: acyltransferase [Acidobacteriaceae bacterium]|nr:acyltransferase [Acidobacteriaceae bacterium]
MSLTHFRRVTSSQSYIPEVDGLRFIAISSVFVYHLAGDILRHSAPNYSQSLAGSTLFQVTQNLNIGVQLFFVLSGFILMVPFAAYYLAGARPVSLPRFYLRRVTRLEPPYIAALLVCFCLKLAGSRGALSDLLPHLGASVFYLHNLLYNRPSDINFACWSLEIEIQFYLLAPLLAFLLLRWKDGRVRYPLFVFLCLSTGVLAWMAHDAPRVGLSLIAQLPYFLAGMFLADVYIGRRRLAQGAAADALFALGAALCVVMVRRPFCMSVVGPLVIATAYWGALRGVWIRKALAIPVISVVGGMCYSIYLLHNFIIAGAGFMTEHVAAAAPFAIRLFVQTLLVAPIVLLLCSGFYLLIERPCMQPDWPRRFISAVRTMLLPLPATPGAETE